VTVHRKIMTTTELPARARILVITLRRLGDVLLTTPLIRSLRRALPDARIAALVFAGTEGILDGNPDLDAVVVAPARETLALVRRLWRRYDLAISTQSGDRPMFLAWAAARRRIGPVEPGGVAARLERLAFARTVGADAGLHRVADVLRLADALGIPRVPQVVCPAGTVPADIRPGRPYAVIHAGPMFRYKRWTVDGWRRLAATLARRGLDLIATGGPAPEERDYLDEVWAGTDGSIRRLDGGLSWPQLAALIGGAQVYVGPDTSVTHLAAASGCPTVALYGPTNPSIWGPWPAQGLDRPWAKAGTVQRRGNVWLVQNPLPCMPCQLEGCARHIESYSQCLDEMPVQQVLGAVEQALALPAKAGPAQ
jgi:heptosyltransferase-3